MDEQPSQVTGQDGDPQVPWVNLWMIAFGVLAMIVAGLPRVEISRTMNRWAVYTLDYPAFVFFAFIALVGIVTMPGVRPRSREPSPDIVRIARLCLSSWRKLLRWKWPLVVFGTLMLLGFVGRAVSEYSYYREYTARMSEYPESTLAGAFAHGFYDLHLDPFGLRHFLKATLDNYLYSALDVFPPAMPIATWGYAAALAGLLIIFWSPWVLARLKGVPSQDGPDRTRFAARVVVFLAVLSAGALALPWVEHYGRTAVEEPGGRRLFMMATMPLGLLFGVYTSVLAGGLLAGLAGCLRMSDEGIGITPRRFLTEAVRYAKPMIGVMLILFAVHTLINLVADVALLVLGLDAVMRLNEGWLGIYSHISGASWRWASLLLIFIPYAVVLRAEKAWGAIGWGIGDLFRNFEGVIGFITLGTTFAMVPTVAAGLLRYMFGVNFWVDTTLGAIERLISVFAYAFVAVAVWEFYRGITGGDEQWSDASPGSMSG